MENELSVITICYNEPNLENTCKNIVNQTFQNFEWVVIDGGSNKETLNIFEKYKYRINTFISEKDSGIYNAMNKGIKLSKGKYLIFMNAGDFFYKNNVLEEINKEGFDKDIIYCNAVCGTDKKAIKLDFSSKKLDAEFFINECLHHQSTFIKKELFEKYGLYNENYKIVSDFEKWIQFIYVNKCSKKHINITCGCNDTSGISCNSKYNKLVALERNKVLNKYFTKKQIKNAQAKIKMKYSLLEQIFSIKNNKCNTHKILTILGIHLKIKKNIFKTC